MACTECHIAKVKCDKVLPCSRCLRLNRVCVKHQSQQGRRKGNTSRKRGRKQSDACGDDEAVLLHKPKDGLQPSEDAALSTELDCFPPIKPDNYGLNYLVRSWISLAFTRRSLSLLSRASAIAARCGLDMDQVLCEHQNQRGMDLLYPILLTPSSEQRVMGDEPLKYSEIPAELLSAVGLPSHTSTNNNSSDLSFMGNRWIWFREEYKGCIRLLCSPAFERDIVPMSLMESTYKANKMAIVDLFLDEKDRYKQIRGLAQQVFSVHATKDVTPKLTRLSCIKLKCNSCPNPIEVDQFNCLVIPNLDHSYYFWEYVRREPTAPAAEAKKPAAAEPATPAVETTTTTTTPAFDSNDLLDVDDWEWDDSELNLILDFLG